MEINQTREPWNKGKLVGQYSHSVLFSVILVTPGRYLSVAKPYSTEYVIIDWASD